MISQQKVLWVFNRSPYVKDPNYNQEQFGCQICLEPVNYPCKCKVCKLLACKECVMKCKAINRKCPKKCTTGQWMFDELPSYKVELNCPYNKDCKDIIYSENFNEHFFKCKHVPEEAKTELKEENLKKRHRCNRGHDLLFMGREVLYNVHAQKCIGCSFKNYCRSYCAECIEYFCCQCRLPKGITSRHCPQNHKFKILQKTSTVVCDICSKSIRLMSDTFCYNDQACDFAVCVSCMATLPQEQSTENYEWEQDRLQQNRTSRRTYYQD